MDPQLKETLDRNLYYPAPENQWQSFAAAPGYAPAVGALDAILDERRRQHAKWGEQLHEMPVWLAILHEETGELSEAVLHKMFGGPEADNVLKEAIQVAAVGMQIVEYLFNRQRAASEEAVAAHSDGTQRPPVVGLSDSGTASPGGSLE